MTVCKDLRLAVIGLGYVGLPLALEFARYRPVVGFDINQNRIDELKKGYDSTLECEEDLRESHSHLVFTSDVTDLYECNCYIVTVPTPIDIHKRPDLGPLISATKMISKFLKKNDLVIYESTVYPGATEEICAPLLENDSKLKYNTDFYCGYSPERINPGDKLHRISSIKKITSGSTLAIGKLVDQLYSEIIKAGTHLASSIKVAEAAKVIENTQRDLNIALMNELSIIFTKLKIDTEEVLIAAGTKWNFLPFRPGLVGGHCIGVDPYYLTHKSQELGYTPEIILAGRRLNDSMHRNVAGRLIKEMIFRGFAIQSCKILVLGITFKENCPDIRNSKSIELVRELESYGAFVEVYDPWVNNTEIRGANLNYVKDLIKDRYEAILIAVAHDEFKSLGAHNIRSLGKENHVLYDLKYVFKLSDADLRL